MYQAQVHYVKSSADQALAAGAALSSVKLSLPLALDAMNAWMLAHPQYAERVEIEWIVSMSFARFIVFPWDQQLAHAGVRKSVAAALLAREFQEDPARYRVRFCMGKVGQPCLAVFLPAEMMDGIASLVRRHRARLTCLAPTLMMAWAHFAALLKKQSGVFNMVEEDRIMRVTHRYGQFIAIELQPSHATDVIRIEHPDANEVSPQLESTLESAIALRVVESSGQAYDGKRAYWLTLANRGGMPTQEELAYAYARCGAA